MRYGRDDNISRQTEPAPTSPRHERNQGGRGRVRAPPLGFQGPAEQNRAVAILQPKLSQWSQNIDRSLPEKHVWTVRAPLTTRQGPSDLQGPLVNIRSPGPSNRHRPLWLLWARLTIKGLPAPLTDKAPLTIMVHLTAWAFLTIRALWKPESL